MKNAIKDHSILYIINTFLFNDRLKYYEKYLNYAKKNDYQICSMLDFWKNRNNNEVKHFILRHDVDYISQSTHIIYELEKRLGVKSTYYFRLCTMDLDLIHDMIENGFEVGFHYETIAEYIKETNDISLEKTNFINLRARLKSEIAYFNSLIGNDYKVSSCASHGAPENIASGYSNNYLLENQDPAEFGILFEAYDKLLYEKYINCHIMDTNPRINYGFAYSANPIEAINHGYRNIIFLAHPNHWYFSIKQRLYNLVAIVFGKIKLSTNRKFKRI